MARVARQTQDDRLLAAHEEFEDAVHKLQAADWDSPEGQRLSAESEVARRRLVAVARGEKPPARGQQTVTIATGKTTGTGKRRKAQTEEVTATVVGCWAVHKSVGWQLPWSVSIIAPGKEYDGLMLVSRRLKRTALAIAEALAADETVTQAVDAGTLKALGRYCYAIADRHHD